MTTPHETGPAESDQLAASLDTSAQPSARYERGAMTRALKQGTESVHQSVEDSSKVNLILAGRLDPVKQSLVNSGEITQGELDRRRAQFERAYIAALKVQYGFERACESLLDDSPLGELVREKVGVSLLEPRASELIAAELEKRGEEIPQNEMKLPEYTSIPEAIGGLYVRIGSRMGGLVIAKMIERSLGEDQASSFYGLLGKETQPVFRQFLRAVDAYSEEGDDVFNAVRSANNTFRAVEAWQRERLAELVPEIEGELAQPGTVGRILGAATRFFVRED